MYTLKKLIYNFIKKFTKFIFLKVFTSQTLPGHTAWEMDINNFYRHIYTIEFVILHTDFESYLKEAYPLILNAIFKINFRYLKKYFYFMIIYCVHGKVERVRRKCMFY